MTFDGIRPEQIGPIRAVSETESAIRPASQQLIHGGRVWARLDPGTERTVTLAFAVRGENRLALALNLARLRHFLLDPGTAELTLFSYPGERFSAFCEEIEAPEVHGLFARVRARMKCTAGSGTREEDGNFTFNGRHCLRDLGCLFEPESMTMVPEQKLFRYEIAGVPGTLLFSEGPCPGERRLTGKLSLVRPAPDAWHEVARWLFCGRQSLVLDREPDWTWEAEVSGSGEVRRRDWENGQMDLAFVLQPYALGPVQVSETELLLSPGQEQSLDLSELRPGPWPAPLQLAVKNVGTAPVTGLRVLFRERTETGLSQQALEMQGAVGPGQVWEADGEKEEIRLDSVHATLLCQGQMPRVSERTESICLRADQAARLLVTARLRERRL